MAKVIDVVKLSKKYFIPKNPAAYTTLVDTLSQKAKKLLKRFQKPFSRYQQEDEYEEFWALKDLTFSVEEGDRLGVIGRNGAGKSTLLKILSRITYPTEGEIKVRGRISSLLEVGTGFHLELTGRENIFLNGAILGMPSKEIRRKFDDIVEFAGIEKFLDTPVKRYSSGMYMRLGFAIAAHMDPDILIVDEVLAVGDMQFQQKCLNKLNDLSSQGRTILFVSHDVKSILSLCNKGLYLVDGQIQSSGPIENCVNAYMTSCRNYSQHWQGNLGNEHVRFYRMSLSMLPERDFIYQGEDLTVEIELEILKMAPGLTFTMELWNQRHQLLAQSRSCDSVDMLQHDYAPGKHLVAFKLDSQMLYEGEYLLKMHCHVRENRIINDEIVVKLPILTKNAPSQFSHGIDRTGIYLGGKWGRGKG